MTIQKPNLVNNSNKSHYIFSKQGNKSFILDGIINVRIRISNLYMNILFIVLVENIHELTKVSEKRNRYSLSSVPMFEQNIRISHRVSKKANLQILNICKFARIISLASML
jgi:hypothetical protein